MGSRQNEKWVYFFPFTSVAADFKDGVDSDPAPDPKPITFVIAAPTRTVPAMAGTTGLPETGDF